MDRELGVGTRLALDRDRAAVLLGDYVVADRQTETGSFAGGLCREEGLEQLVLDLGRNASAVVAHRDLDRVIRLTRRHLQGRAEGAVAAVARALSHSGGVEAVAEQVEEEAGDLLRRHLDWRQAGLKIALPGDVEACVLRPSAVIGEIERLVDQ